LNIHFFIKGKCVSCDRSLPWPHHKVCPYCDEQVRMPMWWYVARVVVPVVCAFSVAGLFPLTSPDWAEAQDVAMRLPMAKSFLFAVTVIVLFAPCRDSDLIASTRAELIIPQIKTLAGCLLIGVSLFAVNFCMAFARFIGWEGYLLYTVATACVCASPFFYRLPPARVVLAVLLLGVIFMPLHFANFF